MSQTLDVEPIVWEQKKLLNTLQTVFGYSQFRTGQLACIQSLLQDERLLCIQPTGYGKSLLYQLPAVLLPGMTMIISPLLALVRDQVSQLNNKFHIPAGSINSDQSTEENASIQQAALIGHLRMLFIAPEQLDSLLSMQFLLQLPISLLVVDEAHCISNWGHDFRPSYRKILPMIKQIEEKNPQLRLLALTATANEKTAADILQQLSNLDKSVVVHRAYMNRDNLRLSVWRVQSFFEKFCVLKQLLQTLKGNGFVYCSTRENTEMVAEFLNQAALPAVAYHAGFAADEKMTIQNDIMQNKIRVVVATNALGMGIDKSDLRFIIHFDMPGSITAYYQEIGRAGRDGLPADGIFIFYANDKKIQQHFIEAAEPNQADFSKVLHTINLAQPQRLSLTEIRRLCGLHPTKINVILAELVEQHFLVKQLQGRTQVYLPQFKIDEPDLLRYEVQREIKQKELLALETYATLSHTCRMVDLCRALDDFHTQACQSCDVCQKKSATQMILQCDYRVADAEISMVQSWLKQRFVPINAVQTCQMSAGLCILDGKISNPLFGPFMKKRAAADAPDHGLSAELMAVIQEGLQRLSREYVFAAMVVIPSTTWAHRRGVAQWIAEQLQVPLLMDCLILSGKLKKRQGALCNNDQRRHNVKNCFSVHEPARLTQFNCLLLLDDYLGSGATLKEAVKILRQQAGYTGVVVPFALAAVKWRFGQSGMVL